MMKNRLLSLLNEIKEVCNESNIPFFLSGELALCKYMNYPVRDNINDATIMVFADDVKKLITLLHNEEKNRIVESLANNKKFPGFYLRYMDTNTTLCNCEDPSYNYETNSIGVDIEIICSRNTKGLRNKVLNVTRKKWHTGHRALYITKSLKGKRFLVSQIYDKINKLFFKIIGNKNNMKKLFYAWLSQGDRNTSYYLIALNNGRLVTMNSKCFDSVRYVDIEGVNFPVVSDLHAFTNVIYPNKPKYKPTRNEFYELDIPWSKYEKVLKAKKFNLKKLQRKQKKYDIWKRRKYTPFVKKRNHYYGFLFCSGDRVKFYKDYDGEKRNRVRELYDAERYHEVAEEIEDYLEAIQYYASRNIGFCFDQLILEIAMNILVLQAVENYIDNDIFKRQCGKVLNIIKNVPVEHFDPSPNVFAENRRDKSVLEKEKERLYESVLELCNAYESKLCEE